MPFGAEKDFRGPDFSLAFGSKGLRLLLTSPAGLGFPENGVQFPTGKVFEMATFNLPDTLTVGVMKKAGVPAVEVDLGKCSAAAIQNAVQQGLKYFFDARLSHKAKATGEAAESPQESVEAVLSRLYAPEWVVRQRGEAAE